MRLHAIKMTSTIW